MDSYYVGRVVAEQREHDLLIVTASEKGIEDPSARLIFVDLLIYGLIGRRGNPFSMTEAMLAMAAHTTDVSGKRATLDNKSYKVAYLTFVDGPEKEDYLVIALIP